jgi:hypothetical protein
MLRFQATLQLKEFSRNKKKLANKLKKKRKKKLKQPRESMPRCLVLLNPLEVTHSALMSETNKTQLKCTIALSPQMNTTNLLLIPAQAMMLLPLIGKLNFLAPVFTKTSQNLCSSQFKTNKPLV